MEINLNRTCILQMLRNFRNVYSVMFIDSKVKEFTVFLAVSSKGVFSHETVCSLVFLPW